MTARPLWLLLGVAATVCAAAGIVLPLHAIILAGVAAFLVSRPDAPPRPAERS